MCELLLFPCKRRVKKNRNGTKKVKRHGWLTWSFSSKFWLPKRRSVPLIVFCNFIDVVVFELRHT